MIVKTSGNRLCHGGRIDHTASALLSPAQPCSRVRSCQLPRERSAGAELESGARRAVCETCRSAPRRAQPSTACSSRAGPQRPWRHTHTRARLESPPPRRAWRAAVRRHPPHTADVPPHRREMERSVSGPSQGTGCERMRTRGSRRASPLSWRLPLSGLGLAAQVRLKVRPLMVFFSTVSFSGMARLSTCSQLLERRRMRVCSCDLVACTWKSKKAR